MRGKKEKNYAEKLFPAFDENKEEKWNEHENKIMKHRPVRQEKNIRIR